MAAIRAGRLLLNEIDRLASSGKDFAFESTLSGVGHLSRLRQWKKWGYRIEIIYLTLPSTEVASRRIATRVKQGGHGVPKADVRRRFQRSWANFAELYRPIADSWMVYDNSGDKPKLIEQGP
jgi:predicted ABC-type ATPase